MASGDIRVGVVGATGVVGETFLLLLDDREFPFSELRLFASDASKGLKRKVDGREFSVTTLADGCFDGLDIVFFSSGDDISKEWAPRAVKSGAIAIDNSGAFRMDEGVILGVPEVNGDLLPRLKIGERAASKAQDIANPNCSTIQLFVALKPLADKYGLEFVRVSSYQSVSGAGKAGIEELLEQTKLAVEGETPTKGKTFPKAIAFDSIPQIGSFVTDGSKDDGFCSEEIKIMKETRKIMRLPDLKVSAFTVRVPTLNSHAETVWVSLKKPAASLGEVEATLASGQGLEVFKRSSNGAPIDYPTQSAASGQDPVFVGRVHRDPNEPNTWMMWVVSDNLRKGAALNGIQIAEAIYGLNK
jgi:aspartate-semialdehyde dehydrogenase